ncbi:MAG TPA: sulfite exporter TauE/SafE family protein [Baekduia sp.]|nr:sulfite exporter TauE/SafE family protein [Baekduia sp.]
MEAALPLALLIGAVMGSVGGGGAVLIVPVLIYVLDQDVHDATSGSLVIVLVAALVGGALQARDHMVCWRAVGVFAPGLVVASLAGSALNTLVDEDLLLVLFSVLVLSASAAMWRKAGLEDGADASMDALTRACPPVRAPRALVAGVAVGLLTGFFGVGGGFVIVPALALWLGFAMRAAVGTSLVVVSCASGVSLAGHLTGGADVVWDDVAPLAAAMAAGVVAGGLVGARLPQAALARAFSVVLAAVATGLLVAVAA